MLKYFFRRLTHQHLHLFIISHVSETAPKVARNFLFFVIEFFSSDIGLPIRTRGVYSEPFKRYKTFFWGDARATVFCDVRTPRCREVRALWRQGGKERFFAHAITPGWRGEIFLRLLWRQDGEGKFFPSARALLRMFFDWPSAVSGQLFDEDNLVIVHFFRQLFRSLWSLGTSSDHSLAVAIDLPDGHMPSEARWPWSELIAA